MLHKEYRLARFQSPTKATHMLEIESLYVVFSQVSDPHQDFVVSGSTTVITITIKAISV